MPRRYEVDPQGPFIFADSDFSVITSFKQTDAEIAAGVTPTNYAYAPGYRARYSTLADQIAVSASHPAFINDDETITATITVPTNAQIYGIGRPQITNSSAGIRIFQGDACANVVIDGIRFKGANSSTAPSGAVGGWANTSTGIVTVTNGSNIRITNCEVDTFYNGISTINCSRVCIEHNHVTHWLTYGIICSNSDGVTVDHNHVVGCDQAGAVGAYGVMITGDETGGDISLRNSISFNVIGDIPSWDGIMTHDCSGLRVIGNDIRNVRLGVDIGHFSTANFIRDIQVIGNYIESTATNTWGATPGAHSGIQINGADATHLVEDVVVSGNIVKNFFQTAGMVLAGNFSSIVVAYCRRANASGNVVRNSGAVNGPAGVFVAGNNDGVVVNGNTIEGAMPAGGVRFASVIADTASICGNTIKQTTVTDAGISITGSTLSAVAMEGNATNSTAPFAQSGSTITWSDSYLRGSATFDPPNLADAAGTTTTVTVTGAGLGDLAAASFSLDLQGISLTAYVSAANTISVRFQNESGGALDLASGTLRVWIVRHA